MTSAASPALCRTCGAPLPGGKWSDACPRCLIAAFGEEDKGIPAKSVREFVRGIPSDELQRIFDRYYRGANQRDSVAGEGIGLAVAREIVTAHGGRIWAASEGLGKGSTFFVALPVVQPDAVPEPVESIDGRGAVEKAARLA